MIKVKVHLCESKGFVSWGIKMFQGMWRMKKKDRFNHFALECEGNIYQSVFSGVEKIPLEKFKKGYKTKRFFVYDIPGFSLGDFNGWFAKYNGRKYDFGQILGIAIKQTLGFNTLIGGKSRRLICNEVYLLCMNRFVEQVVDPKFIDKYDLNMSRDIAERHVEEGKCYAEYVD
ncbi:MAG: hypothetical protein KAX49_19175 [Halanaerobiales bacterium]|nr:hypothetical protein [Halanaerobiales bacterium]